MWMSLHIQEHRKTADFQLITELLTAVLSPRVCFWFLTHLNTITKLGSIGKMKNAAYTYHYHTRIHNCKLEQSWQS